MSEKPPLLREFSAGGLVVRRMRGRPYIAAVRVKDGTVLALPKGHIEPGESGAETAVREVREETGVDGRLVEKLDDIRYWYTRDGARVLKVVSFFLLSYRSGSVRDYQREEVDGAEWVPLDEAPRRLAYSGRAGNGPRSPVEARRQRLGSARVFVLNFYSPVFVDQLRRHRKTATIRLGDKSAKYRKGNVVMVTVGFQHSPREKIFLAVIDEVEVKRVKELSPRDIEHDNPEFRRLDETVHFLEQIYGRSVSEDDAVTDRPLLRDQGDPHGVLRAPARLRAAPELARPS